MKLIGHPTVHWKNAKLNIQVDLDFSIEGEVVEVVCKLISFDVKAHLPLLIITAINLAQAALDLHCFKTGDAITAVLEQLELPGGDLLHLRPSTTEFIGLATAIQTDQDFLATLIIVLTDFEALLALRDLADSIRYTHFGQINCARAIESIRNYFVPKGGQRNDG